MRKKLAKKWMKKMMWRRMMFRMCYGGPFGMGPGAGFGCRMRMMAANMMDSTDTSSSESGDRHEHGAGWRHRRCCRGKKFGRRSGDAERVEDQTTEKGKDHDAEAQVGNTEETNGNAAPVSIPKDGVTLQTISTEDVPNPVESAAGGRLRDQKGRRKEHEHWKCMRRVRFCDMSSEDSSSDSSSSSESSFDENEPAHEVTKSKEHGGRHWRREGRHHHHHQQINGDERAEKCRKGRKAWKGKKFHKKMMKGMGRRGYFRRF